MQQKGLVVDQVDTLPMELSPAAIEFQKNPPLEVPADSQPPKKLADMVCPEPTMTWEEVPTGDGHVPAPISTVPLDAVSGGAKTVEEVVEVEDEKHDLEKDIPPGDLFHAQEKMIRKDQMKEKDAIQDQRKRKFQEQSENPEDGEEEPTSKEKAAAKKQKRQEKAAAKAAAKKQKSKDKAAAKAEAKKQKKKEKAEQKKKIAMDKKEKKAAEKAEKKKKEQEKKAAAKAKAKSKGRKRKGTDDAQETPDPVQQVEEPIPPADPVPPSQPRPELDTPEETQTEKKTFARRNRPLTKGPAARFDACKGVYNKSIKDKVKTPGVLEARFSL